MHEKFLKKEHSIQGYRPTKEENEFLTRVWGRFQQMQQGRATVDKDRWTYQDMLDAVFEPYGDERSSSVVPLESTILELYVAEATKMQTQFLFKWKKTDGSADAEAIEQVWKDDWRKNNREWEITKNEYHTGTYGSSAIYTGFEAYKKTQKDPYMNDDLTISFESKTFDVRNIIMMDVDLRRLWIDNKVTTDIESADDCIFREWESFESFQNLKNSPVYKNIDKVRPKTYSNDYASYQVQEDIGKQQGDFVEKIHYWNVQTDEYGIIANWVVIRHHPMVSTIKGRKALPFAFRRLGYKNHGLYGRGFGEALMMFNSEINDIREMLMDGVRRSGSSVIAIGNGLSFDGRQFSFNNEILTFDGQLANNFQQISGTPPNQAIFSYLDRLYKDIAIYVGIDIQNIVGQPQQTAFQTEVQREASQKRVNVWLRNRDMAFERLANLHAENIQRYYAVKNDKGKYPQLEVEGREYKNNQFVDSPGKHTFEVTPEAIRGDIDFDVHTNVTATTVNAVDRAQKIGALKDANMIVEAYAKAQQMGTDLNKILPLEDALKDVFADHNLGVKEGNEAGEVKDAVTKFQDDLMKMKTKPEGAAGPLDPNQPAPWATAPAQAAAPAMA